MHIITTTPERDVFAFYAAQAQRDGWTAGNINGKRELDTWNRSYPGAKGSFGSDMSLDPDFDLIDTHQVPARSGAYVLSLSSW